MFQKSNKGDNTKEPFRKSHTLTGFLHNVLIFQVKVPNPAFMYTSQNCNSWQLFIYIILNLQFS